MAQIFISYKREDRERARKLAKVLIAKGYDVWWDVELLPGADFYDEITKMIKKAKATIVLWSEGAVGSRPVRSEASLADSVGTLIPVRIDPVIPPLPYNDRHTVDLTGWDGDENNVEFKSLMQAVIVKAGHPVKHEKPESVVEEEIETAEDTWKSLWASVRDLQPESVAEYKHFITKYSETADEEIIAFAERRIAYLSKKKPVDSIRWIIGVGVSAVVLVAAFAQINMWIVDKPKAEKSVIVPKEVTFKPEKALPVKPTIDYSGDNKAFNEAVADGRISAFGNYIQAYPKGLHLQNADQGAWNSAISQNTVAAYRDYKQNFSNGIHIKDAESNIEALNEMSLKKTNSLKRNTLKASCEAGIAIDCGHLGFDFASGKTGAIDFQKARFWYQKACNSKHYTSCTNLAILYQKGMGGPKDDAIAHFLYQQSCENGNAASCDGLAYMYSKGIEVAQNDAKAFALRKKACDGDDAMGCYNLGIDYELTTGITKDIKQAKISHQKACDLGYQKSCEKLKNLP